MSADKTKNDLTQAATLSPERIRDLFPTYADFALSEEELNALPVTRQLELLQTVNYRQKYQILRKSDDSVRLLRELQAEDLYFTLEAAGRTDAMDLVLAATPQQLTGIFDMTCWDKDDFDHEELLNWIGYLLQVDPERAIRKLRTLDDVMLMLMLRRFIVVRRFEWSDDRSKMPDDVFSLDDYYQFQLADPENSDNERLRILLQMLYKLDLDLYRHLMEALVWELPSSIEEAELRARTDRMADRGYTDYLDSLTLFARLAPATLKAELVDTRPLDKSIKPLDEQLPVIYAELLNESSFYAAALARTPEGARENLRNELIYLANRLLVARRSLNDLDRVRDALGEARATLSLGLDYLSDGDADKAAGILLARPQVELFRCGFWLTMELHERARKLFTRYVDPIGQRAKSLISSPARETLVALLRQPPQYYAGADPQSTDLTARPFAALAEFQLAERLVARTEFLFDLHFVALAVDQADVLKSPHEVSLDELDPDMRLVKVFMTVYANARLGREAGYQPLSADDFLAFIAQTLVPASDGGFTLSPALEEELKGWLGSYVSQKGGGYRYLADEWARRVLTVYDNLAADVQKLAVRPALSLSQILLLGSGR